MLGTTAKIGFAALAPALVLALTLAWKGSRVAMLIGLNAVDPNNLRQYYDDDRRLEACAERPPVVFIGDSLPANWSTGAPATWEPDWVNRGIGGQTSREVRARFAQDALALHPRVVHILVGVNDIGKPGAMLPLAETEANIAAMVLEAKAAGVRVVLGTVQRIPPWAWKTNAAGGESAIERLNVWIKAYAGRTNAVVADYWSAADPSQTVDGIHPTRAGYMMMARVAREALAKT
jgi:lysophospholipase L1-like esterase